MLGGRMANLLPLPHLVFENRAGHIHPCSGTGSDTAQSTRANLQSEGLELQSSKNTCLCRCPETPPGRAQTRSGLHHSQILYTFPLQGLKKLLLLLVVWHGVCWLTQPSSSSVASEATGNAFISIWQVRPHWITDMVSYENLLRTWTLFLQSGFFYQRTKHSSWAPGAYQSWTHLLRAGGSLFLPYPSRVWWELCLHCYSLSLFLLFV